LVHPRAPAPDEALDRGRLSAATRPVAWPETPACDAVAAAFAEQPAVGQLQAYLANGGALALVIVRDGVLACEWYGNGGARDRPAAAFSISKTVTSLLLARAVAEGRIPGLAAALTDFVPELRWHLARPTRGHALGHRVP
jgi:CubicO group peptidase (beta-lactamase class C family)